ncbi:MAG: DUF2927 domain-containing protein [Rhodobacterales bacterium]|nr:DUF2927 domain-containing protein [Rhodobacterales bacterium]
MLKPAAVALFGLAVAATALAQEPPSDGVVASALLSDSDLYRLATCGADPGGACRSPVLRWPRSDLSLRIARATAPGPPGFDARLRDAALQAIAQINGVGAGITISLTGADTADITIRPTQLAEGAVLTEVPGFSGAGIMGVGYMTVWSDEADAITEAVILISTSITEADLRSVMLEEMTQSLGFLYDIDGPAYEGVSILSQTSNATVTLEGQDAALLRLHYPPN